MKLRHVPEYVEALDFWIIHIAKPIDRKENIYHREDGPIMSHGHWYLGDVCILLERK